eukprot:TRINITY_DN6411_c0_g1_i1.p1 TRINITY_DN6411_c0_g1~~TRINITY_DN6411_c0_g1_i1.p1  ORF type:complete len:617 (+),score=80.78 TRINITY_DN6411_c0_g1_i1:73-1851(+)
MAMPQHFWRNNQLFDLFRSKPCNRLQRLGKCDWLSQCQYSHCVECPRRPPAGRGYSAELCKEVGLSIADGTNGRGARCSEGGNCPFAHSKDEILYHPHLFKTIFCEEFENSSEKSNGVKGKADKCHRFYCPYAHGPEELRKSPIAMTERQALMQVAIDKFPGDGCCGICAPSSAEGGGKPQILARDASSSPQLQSSPPRKSTYSNGRGRFSPNFQQPDGSMQGNQYMSYRGHWMQGTQVSGCMGKGVGCSPIAHHLFGQSGNESNSGHHDGCSNGQMQSPMRPENQMGQAFQLVQMSAGGMSPCITDSQGCMSMVQMVPMSPPQGPVQPNASMQMFQFSPSLPCANQFTSQESPAAAQAHTQEDFDSLLQNANLGHLVETLKVLGYETAAGLCSLSEDHLENMDLAPNDQLSLCKVVEKCKEQSANAQGANCWMSGREGMRQGVSMQPAMQPAMMVGAYNGYPCIADNSYQVMWSPPQIGFQPQTQQSSPAQYTQVPPFPYSDQIQQTYLQEATPPRAASKEAATPPQNGKGSSAGFTPSPPPVPALPWKSHGQDVNGKNSNGHGNKIPSKSVKRRSQQEQIPEQVLAIMNS